MANVLMGLVDRRLRDHLTPEGRRMHNALTGKSWRSRYDVLRQAHSGESPVTDLLVALQMGVSDNRAGLDIVDR
jgi:hypothetical protein